MLFRSLTQLEQELGDISHDINALSNERDIRATNTLVRTLEKVLQLEQKDIRQRRSYSPKKLNNAERDELTRRIANLPEESEVVLGVSEAASDPRTVERVALLGTEGSTSA